MPRLLLTWLALIGLAISAQAQLPMTGAGPSAGGALRCSFSPNISATYNVAYSSGTPSASGGTPGYTFSNTGTSFAASGYTLNTSTGEISGTDSTDSGGATYPGIQIAVTDSAGSPATANCGTSFTITVSSPGMVTPVLSGLSPAPSTSVVNYASLIGGSAFTYQQTAIREYPIPISGTFSNLSVNFVTSASPGTYAVALTKNGSTSGTPNCTVTTNTCSDAVNTISVSPSDLVSYKITPTSTPSSSANTQYGIEFTSLNSNESFLAGGPSVSPNTSANNWSAIQGAAGWYATNDAIASNVMPAAGVIDKLYVVGATAPGAGKSYTITVNQNGSAAGSPGNLSCTLTGTGSGAGITTCNDLTDSITVAAGDTISVESAPSSTPAADNIRWGVRWKPTTTGQSLLLMSDSSTIPGTTATTYSYVNGGASAGATETSNEVLSPAISGGFSITGMYVAFSAAPTTGTRIVTLQQAGSPTTMLCALSLTAAAGCTPTAVTGISTATLFDWKQVSAGATATTSYKVGATMTVP